MRRWSTEVVEEWKRLRSDGWSYGRITKSFGVNKSTLSYWLKDVDDNGFRAKSRAEWAKNIQPLGAAANRKKRQDFLRWTAERVKVEMKSIGESKEDLKAMLSLLYWAEGSKGEHSSLRFVNTDPKLALLFVTLLRRCYEIDGSRLKVWLHLHYYHRAGEAKKFWSELLGIPQSQFGKIYWKKRSKTKRFRRNFGGICSVEYNSVRLKDEVMACALAAADRLVEKLS